MTIDEATRVVAQALPCPFCGEQLTVQEDDCGYIVAHKSLDCIADNIIFLYEDDLSQWNRRKLAEAEREEWNKLFGVTHPPGSPPLCPEDAALLRAIFTLGES